MVRRNPSVRGDLCVFCGRPAESFGHFDEKGMGGVGIKGDESRHHGAAVCGRDHVSDPSSCHFGLGNGYIIAKRKDDGTIQYMVSPNLDRIGASQFFERFKRRVPTAVQGITRTALYEDVDPDAVDIPREDLT